MATKKTPAKILYDERTGKPYVMFGETRIYVPGAPKVTHTWESGGAEYSKTTQYGNGELRGAPQTESASAAAPVSVAKVTANNVIQYTDKYCAVCESKDATVLKPVFFEAQKNPNTMRRAIEEHGVSRHCTGLDAYGCNAYLCTECLKKPPLPLCAAVTTKIEAMFTAEYIEWNTQTAAAKANAKISS